MRALFAVVVVAFGPASSLTAAERPLSYQGLDVAVVGVERTKSYKDLRVKDEKKQDLALVRLSVKWTDAKRSLLIKDSDLGLREAKGKKHGCALSFVQAIASPGAGEGTLDVPFQVPASSRLKWFYLGGRPFDLESLPGSATAATGEPAR